MINPRHLIKFPASSRSDRHPVKQFFKELHETQKAKQKMRALQFWNKNSPSIFGGICAWLIGRDLSSFLADNCGICIGIETSGTPGSKIEAIPDMFMLPKLKPGMPLLFNKLGGEFSRFALENPLECCCDIVIVWEFCRLAVVLIRLSSWLCIDICANPCCRFIFILAMLICPIFRLEATLVDIMFTAGFTSGRRFRLELLFAECDVWIIGIWDSFFDVDKAWSKLVCVVVTDAIWEI